MALRMRGIDVVCIRLVAGQSWFRRDKPNGERDHVEIDGVTREKSFAFWGKRGLDFQRIDGPTANPCDPAWRDFRLVEPAASTWIRRVHHSAYMWCWQCGDFTTTRSKSRGF